MFPYWDDGVLQDDRRLQDGWALSPSFKAIAMGGKVIKCPSPLNVLKHTYEHSCY